MEEHRSALRFDFRRFYGCSLDTVGEAMTFGEAWDLVDELRRQPDSHLFADLADWDLAVSWGDVMATLHAEAYANVHREPDAPLIDLPKPWSSRPRERVTVEERDRLRAQLIARSAFRDS